MGKLTLSKSSFIKGLQCQKYLYLYKHHYDWQDPISDRQQAIFNKGHDVGFLAQKLFPGGIDSSPSKPSFYAQAAKKTKKLIESGQTTIYEAVFINDDVVVIADILTKDSEGWKIYEVKSSTSVSQTHIYDASIQYYVITKCGLDLKDAFITHINNQYIREDELDIHQFFNSESVLEDVLTIQDFVEDEIQNQKALLKSTEIPNVDIGLHCSDPYQCAFKGYCWKHIPENSVFDIKLMHLSKKFEFYYDDIISMDDFPDNYILPQKQAIQLHSYKTSESIIEKEKIQEFISEFKYPLYFMDFESFQPAVPLYRNSKPYQQIPLQYSIHFQHEPDSEIQHFEILAEADLNIDPRIGFIEGLIKDLGTEGDIVVYNKAFEMTRLKEIARDFWEYSDSVNSINERIVDLMIPFQRKWYYTPEMKGSYSIKAVLPALVPEMNYDDLEIAEGMMASLQFESLMYEKEADIIYKTRNDLLKYCEMDTLAMVKIYESLK
ncbi:MAG: DUF2779 domain-containing protein [Melioribacteraceae bacterium]|nr:DUF2779 domain-containing protein [Melioribacteraceae bacterium]